jgi:hypothetical protein
LIAFTGARGASWTMTQSNSGTAAAIASQSPCKRLAARGATSSSQTEGTFTLNSLPETEYRSIRGATTRQTATTSSALFLRKARGGRRVSGK